MNDQQKEIVRSALERYMDDRNSNTDKVLLTLDDLFPECDYLTDEDREYFEERVAGIRPGEGIQ